MRKNMEENFFFLSWELEGKGSKTRSWINDRENKDDKWDKNKEKKL